MPTEKSIASILVETKIEIVRFITTRVGLFKAEMEGKLIAIKRVAPLFVVALAFLSAAWTALTFGLIALLHVLFLPSVFAWAWAALIVAGLYLAIGALAARAAFQAIQDLDMTPNRTLTVLKQDQIWIENEARTA